MSFDARLQRLWYAPAWHSLPLWPLSLSFRGAVALRMALHRAGVLPTEPVPVPVIVVGNVTVGGTGKTPVAAWLARELTVRGYRVGVVLRGYGAGHRGAPRSVGLSDNPADVGDEALLHARRGVHVVVIGAGRAAAARLAAAQGAEVIVSDDGLQHLRLPRDYEIAVLDGQRGLGNGWLLPAGPLREPASRLERVHAVVVTERAPGTARVAPVVRGPLQVPARLALGDAVNVVTGERRSLTTFAATGPLHAVAAIGHPEAFFRALRAAGLDVVPHALPDHAAFDPAALGLPAGATVLMTEKDAVKCTVGGRREWWWVDLGVTFARSDAQTLLASILERTGLAVRE